VESAIDYEIDRQIQELESGRAIIQETRGWDDAKKETYSQRAKESSHDYRYFPEPDIPKLKISEVPEFASPLLRAEIPELPEAKRKRFAQMFGMTPKEVAVFVDTPPISNYFESVISAFPDDTTHIKLATNYILSDYLGLLKTTLSPLETISPVHFSELIQMIATGDLSSRGGKDVLGLLLQNSGASPRAIAEQHDLIQKSDLGVIAPIIEKILSDNTEAVVEYKAGKTASLQFLIGQAMKATKGSANPEVVKNLLIEKLQTS